MERVKIFDTTLRDGEQTPRVSLNKEEKVAIALQLEELGVDIIEAGFPIASDGDFEAVRAVARAVSRPVVCGLARCDKRDIDRAAEALKDAAHPRIHVFLATSDIHLKYKLEMTREECMERAVEMVAYAKTLVDDIQFSAEDATRSDPDFLCEIFEKVIEAGATTINIPDTVGFIQTEEYEKMLGYIMKNTPGMDKVTVSVHCHDDFGLATANAMAGVRMGARQVECTVNALGERAGNTSLEEAAMIIDTRGDYYGVYTGIDTEQIYRTSKLVSAIAGVDIGRTKSVVGENCFLHESGIHQAGILKNRRTYEVMDPTKIGIPENDGLVLGKHSGRHAFAAFLKQQGILLPEEGIATAFRRFKSLADNKKYITVEDILSMTEDDGSYEENYRFHSYNSSTSEDGTVTIYLNVFKGEKLITQRAEGNGQVDAAYNALNTITGEDMEVVNFEINAITGHSNAQGEAKVRMKLGERQLSASGLDKDVIKAAILAYIQGINKFGVA